MYQIINYISGNPKAGANSAGISLSSGFDKLGVQSKIYNFRTNEFSDNYNHDSIKYSNRFNSKVGSVLAKNDYHKFTVNIAKIPIRIDRGEINRSIGILHYWSDGGPTWRQIYSLAVNHKNFFIILRDLRLLTGGCHYPLECHYFHKSCEKCAFSYIPNFLRQNEIQWIKKILELKNVTVLTLNQFDAELVNDSFPSLDIEAFNIDNVISDTFANLEPRGTVEYDVVFGSINSGDKYKGPDRLISAGQYFKTLKCATFGSSKNFSQPQFDSLGTLEPAALRDLFLKSKFLFVPSIRETFNKIVAEAVCCGCYPIVFKNSIGPESIIEGVKFGSIINSVQDLDAVFTTSFSESDIFSARLRAIELFNSKKIASNIISLL